MSEEYKPITNLWKDSEGYRYFGTLKLSSKIKYDGDDFIPLWEWVKQLQQENKQLQEELEWAIGIVEHNRIISKKNKEIHQLKKQLETYEIEGHKQEEELDKMSFDIRKYKIQQKEFIKYLEDEKDRLARENSNIYEDSLGKTRLVNEDIFNKINLILQKYKEIIGDDK